MTASREKLRAPWILRVPPIFQTSSPLLFIAVLLALSGLAAVFGFSDPHSITSQMALPFYKIWGGTLFFSGTALVYGIFRRDTLIEKYSARLLTLGLAVFGAWALVAVGFERSLLTLMFVAAIAFFLEQRISTINALIYAKALAAKYSHLLPEEKGDI